MGNWLTAGEAAALWQVPDGQTLTRKHNRAILPILLDCGLRRRELAEVTLETLQRREGKLGYPGFRLSGWRGSVSSCSSPYSETISGISARPCRDSGGATGFSGSCFVAAWRKTPCRAYSAILCASDFAIAQTDLVLTVPRRLAKITAVMAGVRVVEAPREIKSFPYFVAWHPRLTNEPAHEWFREQLRSAVRTV